MDSRNHENTIQLKTQLEAVLLTQKRLILEYLKPPFRPVFETIDISSRGTLLVGPRGVGKTTFLISLCKKSSETLYLNLDNITLVNLDLYAFCEFAYMNGYRFILLDEIHFRPHWTSEIKSLYDNFPKLKVIVSDSSILILRKGNADLSRRFPLTKLPLLSFREFLILKTGLSFSQFDPIQKQDIPKEYFEFEKTNPGLLARNFEEYLNAGQRPIFLEGRYEDRILNIVDKIISSDIPYFLPHIEANHLSALRSIVDFLATAAIPTINISALCSQWEIGKTKVYDLLKVLQEASVINIVFNTKTPKAFSKGDKILFCDCSFYHVLGPQLGSRREAYFVSTLKNAGYTVLTSKDEEQYDFQVKNINFEVGGKNKKKKKSDIVIQENLDIKTDTRWPLWTIGCLW